MSMAIEDFQTRSRGSKPEDILITGDQDLCNYDREQSGTVGDLKEAKSEDILITGDQDQWNFDRERSGTVGDLIEAKSEHTSIAGEQDI